MSDVQKQYGLTPTELRIFEGIRDWEGQPTTQELATYLRTSPESVKVLICRMRKKGAPIPKVRRKGAFRKDPDGNVKLERYTIGEST